MSKPVSLEHALYIGVVFGLAMKHGLNVEPVVDEDGDYGDEMVVHVGGRNSPTITLVVPEPPEDWSLEAFLEGS